MLALGAMDYNSSSVASAFHSGGLAIFPSPGSDTDTVSAIVGMQRARQ